jgi:transposase InsO family protein
LASEIDYASLADGVDLIPVGAEPLDRLGAVADEAAALQLEQRQGADEHGLERYNYRRPHSSLGHQPPGSRLNNLVRNYT